MGSPMKAGVSIIISHLKSGQNKQQDLAHPDNSKLETPKLCEVSVSPLESHRESAAALGGFAEAGVQAEESLGHARGGAAPSATA